MENYDVKFLCSYGGEIHHSPNDNKISYLGGHNKILYVNRGIHFTAMLAELSALFDAAGDICFKYQLPGDEQDALISVTCDSDLNNLMLEYDNLYKNSPKTARMRLFIFPGNGPDSASTQSGPAKPKSKVNGSAVVPPQITPVKDQDLPPVDNVNTSDQEVDSDPKVNRRVEDSDSPRSNIPLQAYHYDVFISFRGKDTRASFTSYLYKALSRKQIVTYADDLLHKEDSISSLRRVIEESCVSLVVFSENYASSKWCLEELVKIMECKKEYGRLVLPVFYKVDPSHVRHQQGSYSEAFKKHLQNNNTKTKVQKWREVLTAAANLEGLNSQCYRDEIELIQNIVKDVLQKLIDHNPPNDSKNLVGIRENLKNVKSLLSEFVEVPTRMIGICGMGGIGKTTLARLIFEEYSYKYEGSCFLENVRERSGKYGHGLAELRHQLCLELLQGKIWQNNTGESTFVVRRLSRQRNFIVLDDVSSLEQLEKLVGDRQLYGAGSKIIITARDKSMLVPSVETIYEMKILDSQESFQLFSLNAFNEDYPQIGYEELSWKAVGCCKGIPLALIVLGSFLHSRRKTEWHSALQKLEKTPDPEIQDVLRLSYDGLDYQERQIFLDIACFFKGELVEHAVNLLDGCGFNATIGMRSLLDKALITISHNYVWMHDLIQELGWKIVCQQSIENRSHLWDSDDVRDVLGNNKGADSIESIVLDMSQIEDLHLSVDTFKKMPKLRFLKLHISSEKYGSNLQLPVGLKPFSDKLRYLEWHAYPLPSLPSNFCPEKLVTLRIRNSQLKRLWDGVQNLVNLEEVDLTGCRKLVELPDFSKANNLKSVHLSDCRSLRHVHPSLLSLGKLEHLDLLNCAKLEMLETKIHSKSLKHLYVNSRKSSIPAYVNRLSFFLRKLLLDGSPVETLPRSIKHLPELKTLSLKRCKMLQYLPELPSSIRHLTAVDCIMLQTVTFSSNIPRLQEEKRINISFQNCMKLDVENCIYRYLEYVRKLAYECESRRGGKGVARRSDFFKICYPGYRVPEWFIHWKKGASITFEVSSSSNYGFGSLLCVVLSKYSLNYELDIKCRCYLEDGGNVHKYSFGILFLNHIPAEGYSEHVYMAYNYGGIFDVIKLDRLNNKIASSGQKPKVTFEFFVSSGDTGSKQEDNLIKECGVYPLNDSSFITK